MAYTLAHRLVEDNDITKLQELLLDPNAPVDTKDEWGWTPLLLAARKDLTNIVKLLVSSGRCDVNAITSDGSVLHWLFSDEDTVMFLLNNGVDCNLQDRFGSTFLHVGFVSKPWKYVNIARYCIEHKNFNIHLRNKRGQSILFFCPALKNVISDSSYEKVFSPQYSFSLKRQLT